MYCPCSKDQSLNDYVLVYVADPSVYVNHNFVRNYGVIVDSGNREHPLLRNHESVRVRNIRAYTIADAFRLVEWEAGANNRKPLHRVLDIDKEIIIDCGRQNKAFADLTQSALERFMAR